MLAFMKDVQVCSERRSVCKAWCHGLPKKKRVRKACYVKGCTNDVKKGGVCIKHGANVVRKTCSTDGCTNYVQRGGVYEAWCKAYLQSRGMYQSC